MRAGRRRYFPIQGRSTGGSTASRRIRGADTTAALDLPASDAAAAGMWLQRRRTREVSSADISEPENQCEGVIDRAQFGRVEPPRAGAESLRVNDRYLLDQDPCFAARDGDRR